MRRRKLLVALAGLAVLAVLVGALALFPWRYRVSQHNMNLIRQGMSWADVTAIFGPPDAVVDGKTSVASQDVHQAYIWEGDDGMIVISFGTGVRVSSWRWSDYPPEERGILAAIIRRINHSFRERTQRY
jgi:hypothetical protein